MSLFISHDCWEDSYIEFSKWRCRIAELGGYNIGWTEFEKGGRLFTINIDWRSIKDENILGKWEITPDDPLLILIAHSDYDGKIYNKHLILLAERIDNIIDKMELDDYDFKNKTLSFVKGLRKAHLLGNDIEFK